jgi:eukaryotic-like serine/threonine-protein kinase
LRWVGRGAGSDIYAARDLQTGAVRAVKHVVRTAAKDIRFVDQLRTEFDVCRRFDHPGLRRAFALRVRRSWLGRVTDAMLVLELIDGDPLEQIAPMITLADLVGHLVGAAQALHVLSGLGYVHCDLKPNNVLVGPKGRVTIIDFGQACKTGTVKPRIQGTPDYIAPEQATRRPVTVRTDVFNFGATMYWTLVGKPMTTLFNAGKGENAFVLDVTIPTPIQVNPRIPEPLSRLVMDCVRTNPLKRPADFTEVLRRLEVMHYALTRESVAAPASAPVA